MGQPAKVFNFCSSYRIKKMDAKAEVERLASLVKTRRKSIYEKSKIDKYKHEILRLKAEGATLEMLQLWLKEQRIKADLSTISRWLKKHG
jgi:hypothetical protein